MLNLPPLRAFPPSATARIASISMSFGNYRVVDGGDTADLDEACDCNAQTKYDVGHELDARRVQTVKSGGFGVYADRLGEKSQLCEPEHQRNDYNAYRRNEYRGRKRQSGNEVAEPAEALIVDDRELIVVYPCRDGTSCGE